MVRAGSLEEELVLPADDDNRDRGDEGKAQDQLPLAYGRTMQLFAWVVHTKMQKEKKRRRLDASY